MKSHPAVVAALFALVLFAGCGGDDSSDSGTAAETSTVTETKTEAATTDESESTDSDPAQEEGTDGDSGELTLFQSPSGNIGCALDATLVRCDIGERSWNAGSKPSSCELDYGNGIEFAPGGQAEFTCAGDTVLGQGETLAYGESKTVGELTCDSEAKGVTCTDVAGSGFFISKESYEFLMVDAG